MVDRSLSQNNNNTMADNPSVKMIPRSNPVNYKQEWIEDGA
jgi:hypothetical protein